MVVFERREILLLKIENFSSENMPSKSKKTSFRRQGRTRGIIETFTFSVLQGNTSKVLKSTITSLPPRSNFRPVWLEVEVCGYSPGSSSEPGYMGPVGCQLNFIGYPVASYCSTSRLCLAGSSPRKVRTYYPRSSDWMPYNLADTVGLADISAVCVGKLADTSGYLRGVGRMMLIVQEEVCANACPAIGDVID